MTVLPPVPSALFGDPNNPDPTASGPIITTLPATTAALQKKYTTLAPQLSQLPPGIVNTLYQYDTQRAMRGAQPLGNQQTFNVLSSALTGQAATPQKQRSISPFALPGNAVHDLANILSSVPRIPLALYHEAKALPEVPGDVSKALAAGSPSKVLTQLTEVPGIRMIPGAFTVHSLASGHPGELLQHPLQTLLDIYPAAKELGLTGKLAEQVSSVSGKLADTTAGQDALMQLKGNRGVQFLQEAFGKTAREDAVRYHLFNKALEHNFAEDQAMAFAEKWSKAGFTPEEHAQVFDAAERGRIDTLPDKLQPYANDIRTESNRLADIGDEAGLLKKTQDYGGAGYTEILDNRTATKYLAKLKAAEVAQREGSIRAIIQDPTTAQSAGMDVGQLSGIGSKAALADPNLFDSATQRTTYLRGVTHAIDAMGYDAKPLRDLINETAPQVPRARRVSLSTLATAFDDFAKNPTPLAAAPTLEEVASQFSSAARRDPKVAVMLDNIKNGHYQNALETARGIDKRTTFRPDEWDGVVESIKRMRDKDKYLSKPPIFDDSTIARAAKNVDKYVRNNAPARFKTEIVNRAIDNVKAQYADSPDITKITSLLAERNFSQYPGLKEAVESSVDEISRTWQSIRDEGIDPVFIHHVSPASAGAITHPSVFSTIPGISWAAKRTMDITPYVPDATVAIPNQALEILRQQATRSFLDDFISSHARHAEEALGDKLPLINDYLDRARRRFPNNPELVRQEAERLMKREWTKFDPNTILPKGSRLTNFGKQTDYWVPKTTLRNLERIAAPLDNGFTTLMDPIMGMFRTSVLALAPRWQLNNIVGGGMIAAVEDPGILTYMAQTLKAMKADDISSLPDHIKDVADRIGIGTGLGQLPRESLEWNRIAAESTFQFAAGKTMGRLLDETAMARGKVSGLIQKAYKANEFIDDAYRAAAYLRGYDKSITAGLSPVEAEAAGIQLSRKILQRWDEMTPLERTVMRYSVPFYGWAKFIMPYVLKYPFDHPLRAAIMSSITRNEIHDMGTGLPERFLNAFFLGHPDSKGHVRAIQVGGLNPFSGVSNYFTMAGLAGNLNPIAASLLQAMGVDTANGGPELYPELTYDPESGRIVTKGKSFLPALLSNTIPQAQILLSLAGASADFKSLLASNPGAARRQLISAGGIPLLMRQFNIPEEQIKAELARESAQDTAKSAALKSGDIGALNQYPALRGYAQQLQALQDQGRLAPYNPNLLPKPTRP